MTPIRILIILATFPFLCAAQPRPDAQADLILHNGKVLTVNDDFAIVQALAVKADRILAVGTDADILRTRGPSTKVIDLAGRMVLPGLIDSHVHPDAAMTEFDHPIPEMESIDEVLTYVRDRAKTLGPGKWIELRQVFITRLREQRYPTRAELDAAAPDNPVVFSTGPDASLNTLALKLSGIDKDFKVTDGGPGHAEKDPKTGELTGILRSATRYVKVQSATKAPTEDDRLRRTIELFNDYNSVGLTAVADRNASPGAISRYQKLRDSNQLTVRLTLSHQMDHIGPLERIEGRIRALANHPLRKDDPMLRLVGIKMFLDGGMLTGSAYMRQPWGVSQIYSITDPNYRGLLFIPPQRLVPMVRAAAESGLQFTAHSVGDGAVHTLLDAYEEVSKAVPNLRDTRPCITHCNFMSAEAIEKMARLGVAADIQPAWLYLDARTLTAQFGYDRLRYFQPLKSIFASNVLIGGGSDHMQKIGSLRSVNPYNPFLAMQTAITRRAKWFDRPLHPEEALTREQAIRFYTINNARLLFRDHQTGSLEPGKLADLVVLDTDLLTCPEDRIKDTRVLQTFLAGRAVYEAK